MRSVDAPGLLVGIGTVHPNHEEQVVTAAWQGTKV
jgi:hypothetical protein